MDLLIRIVTFMLATLDVGPYLVRLSEYFFRSRVVWISLCSSAMEISVVHTFIFMVVIYMCPPPCSLHHALYGLKHYRCALGMSALRLFYILVFNIIYRLFIRFTFSYYMCTQIIYFVHCTSEPIMGRQ